MKKPQFIDIHILQTVPPSNINRDDTGSPKTAYFGGVKRSRVSSQAWKKAARDLFPDFLDEANLGTRTKYAVRLIAKEATNLDAQIDEQEALESAKKSLKAYLKGNNEPKFEDKKIDPYKLKALLFISPYEVQELAKCVAGLQDVSKVKSAVKNKKSQESASKDMVDISLFGRMVATDPSLNVDASVQVAHAIGIGKMNPEFDYFTALDDCSPEDNAGAAMIETTEFTSSTMYRYATIDVLHLCENLGSAAVACRGIEAFLKAFVTSMPTGKQNSFANRTLPGAVVLQLRDTQPVSLVNAFEKPVEASHGKSQIEIGCERLAKQEEAVDKAFGTTPQKTFVITASPDAQSLPGAMGVEGACSLDAAIAQISQACAAYLAENGYQTEEVD